MKWNDLAFWKKLAIGFGALLVLLVVSAALSVQGISESRRHSGQVQYIDDVHELFIQKTLDHYRWLSAVDMVLMDGSSQRLGVETDDHQCQLGNWLYGEDRRAAEVAIPAIKPLLARMEAPHSRLHASAIEIDKVLSARNAADSAAVTQNALGLYRGQTLKALDDLGGVMEEVKALLERETQAAKTNLDDQIRRTTTRVVTVSAIALVAGILLSVFMTRSITSRISQLKDFSSLMAEGNFTGRLDIDQKDEIGSLADSLKKMRQELGRMFGTTIDEVVGLSSSSNSLFGVAQQLAEGAEDMTGRANTVAAAAEEMSSNMNSVAAASEQAATNVNMVAAAAEEMTSTVRDIAGSSEKGRTITSEAVAKAKSASIKVNELGSAAAEISKVTEVITEISEQTNLLALNATIEAARAGEAGKGFAVVANEIKELAKQTAGATQDIKNKVAGIQTTTSATVTEIEEISQVIRNVNDIVGTIASAVEQQATATQEIAENVAQASQGIGEVNENVAQSSAVATEIARDIAQVSHISEDIREASQRVSGDAGDLSKTSQRIKEMMQAFRIDESAMGAAASTATTAAVPDLIRWDSTVQLGIKIIDGQHKRLVDLINALNRAMKQRKGREAMNSVFADLVDYTKHHFGDEEKLMKKFDYDGLAEQEAQHRHFVKKMSEMQQQVKSGNAMVTMDLMDFLKEWLVKHIKGTDKNYQAFFKAKGVA